MGQVIRNCLAALAAFLLLAGMPSCYCSSPTTGQPQSDGRARLHWATTIGDRFDGQSGLPLRVRRNSHGAVMHFVAGGSYLRGAVPGDAAALADEKPRSRVSVGPFYVDRTEVTVEQFTQFVQETGYVTDCERTRRGAALGRPPTGRPRLREATWRTFIGMQSGKRPVTLVSWNDAQAYCKWAGCQLPTETQFEYLLRNGAESAVYPWGSTPNPPTRRGNYRGEEFARAYFEAPCGLSAGVLRGCSSACCARSLLQGR